MYPFNKLQHARVTSDLSASTIGRGGITRPVVLQRTNYRSKDDGDAPSQSRRQIIARTCCAFEHWSLGGWKQSDDWVRFVLAIGLPVITALVWGTFNVPDDPSRGGGAPIVVSGVFRLVIESGIFVAATWALHDVGYAKPGLLLFVAVAVHYVASHERIIWLLTQSQS